MSFASRLRMLREDAGMNMSELASKLGVNYKTYFTWENGKEPKISVLVKIAHVLNVSLDDLLGRDGYADEYGNTVDLLGILGYDVKTDTQRNVYEIKSRDGFMSVEIQEFENNLNYLRLVTDNQFIKDESDLRYELFKIKRRHAEELRGKMQADLQPFIEIFDELKKEKQKALLEYLKPYMVSLAKSSR